MSAATITRNGGHVDRIERTNAYHRAVLWSWAQLRHLEVDMHDDCSMPTQRLRWQVRSLDGRDAVCVERDCMLNASQMGAVWRGAANGFRITVC